MALDPLGVRPTRRCLDDIRAQLPDLGTPLDEVADPVVVSAQAVPEQRDAGGAERVVTLTDRVWFKVKTGDRHAAATELRRGEIPEWIPLSRGAWWIGAAGRRQGDSPQRDFYAVLQRECTSGKTVSTDHLLPVEWDWRRLTAEQAVAWRREMKRMVIRLVGDSLTSGHVAVAEFRKHRIKALARAANGHEAYLAIIAEGVPDQLLDRGEDLDLTQVRATCVRLFEYRRQQTWRPTIAIGDAWDTLYAAAVEDVDALPDVEAAVGWVNAFVERIEAAKP